MKRKITPANILEQEAFREAVRGSWIVRAEGGFFIRAMRGATNDESSTNGRLSGGGATGLRTRSHSDLNWVKPGWTKGYYHTDA